MRDSAAVVLLVLASLGQAEAQTFPRSFQQLIPGTGDAVIDRTASRTSVAREATPDSSRLLMRPVSLQAATLSGDSFRRTLDRETHHTRSAAFASSAVRANRQSRPQKRSWIGRHPVLFGTLVGFGAGFLIGYLPGDDGVLDDFTATFNGWVVGGVGAGAGALTGAVVGAMTK